MAAPIRPLLTGAVLTLGYLAGCTRDSPAPTPPGSWTIHGSIQKGPFVLGSDVTIQGLDARLSPTGTGYFTRTTSDLGRFALDVPLPDSFVEVRTTGYYFNEVSDRLSVGPISLTAIAERAPDATVQVNLLTTLEHDRIATLVRDQGLSFADARQRAEEEVLQAFHLPVAITSGGPFTSIDMEHGDAVAGALVAVSAMIQGWNTEAQLTELVARLAADIAVDGALGPEVADLIAKQAAPLDADAIRSHLQRRFAALGINIVLPDISSYIDPNRPIPPPDAWASPADTEGARWISLSTPTPDAIVFYRSEDALSTPGPWLTGGAWIPFQGRILLDGVRRILVLSTYSAIQSDPTKRSQTLTRAFTTQTNTYGWTPPTTVPPVFTPLAGTYGSQQMVTLTSDAGAPIYFTTDGTTPTTSSTIYSGPVQISAGPPIVLKAIAVAPDGQASAVVTSWYEVNPTYPLLAWPPLQLLDEARWKMTGTWVGWTVNPWADFAGLIDFRPDGTYSAGTLNVPGGDWGDHWFSFLYNGLGIDGTWEITDLSLAGLGVGALTVDGDASWQLEMTHVALSDDGAHLRFDLGQLQYDLTRLP